ncbi:M14 family metallopeptidase [Paenibacillus abyssi]|uniref:Peptidase M14 n=1 Tax=Paenibacillus abyssi TaxID=1340531 RepID=A0A917FZX0_9BACL|nr:M14 family metallopeptidase [Paenibacillus abyssi]GGG15731.1 peptidase M14 [Paenibacillus abyssi]
MNLSFTYMVQPGDTLLRIAGYFGVNEFALLAANPRLTHEAPLIPGLILTIPSANFIYYCLQPGDTLNDLTERLHVSVYSLLTENPQLDPKHLIPGQTLKIPAPIRSRIIQAKAEYGYRNLRNDIETMVRDYPFLKQSVIGQSVMGKPLPALRFGRGAKKVHVNAAFHANEWITTPLIMRFMEDLARGYKLGAKVRGEDCQSLYEHVTLWVVPMVNPDGVELVLEGATPAHPYYEELLRSNRFSERFQAWKANIRGVDLNDQFPAHWEAECERRGHDRPGPRDYPGPHPLSEPEAQAMADFTREQQFDLVIALHTQGQEIYWNYRDYEPPAAEEHARQLAEASGYRAVKLAGSDAGYKDWFIQEFRKPGFTVEAGIGVNPLPLDQFEDMYDAVQSLLLQALRL